MYYEQVDRNQRRRARRNEAGRGRSWLDEDPRRFRDPVRRADRSLHRQADFADGAAADGSGVRAVMWVSKYVIERTLEGGRIQGCNLFATFLQLIATYCNRCYPMLTHNVDESRLTESEIFLKWYAQGGT